MKSICCTAEVFQSLSNRHTSWKFIVAKSPWWAEFYEWIVLTVKKSLRIYDLVNRTHLGGGCDQLLILDLCIE